MTASIHLIQSPPRQFAEGAPPRINGQIQAFALSAIATFVSFVVLPWQAALVVSIGMTTFFHMLCGCPDRIDGPQRPWYEPLNQIPAFFRRAYHPPAYRPFYPRPVQHEEFRFPASQPFGSSSAHSVVGGGHTSTPVSRTFAPSAPPASARVPDPLDSISVQLPRSSSSSSSSSRVISGVGHTPAPINRSPEPPPPSTVARAPVGAGHTSTPASTTFGHPVDSAFGTAANTARHPQRAPVGHRNNH